MSKHTPGPWIARTPKGSWPMVFGPAAAIAKTDCSINGGDWVEDLDIAEANARLIASAPELLEALEDLLYVDKKVMESCNLDHGPGDRERVERAIAAIRKAKGEA